MALVKFEIVDRQPFLEGAEFGDVGPYERIEARAHYALDPSDPNNSALTDIEHVECGDDGQIRFSGDVSMLIPKNPSRGNRVALVEVPNRGKRTAQRQFNFAPIQIENSSHIDAGDGFLMRHGWSVVWCGWQWDVPEGAGGMGVDAPLVNTDRAPHPSGKEQMQLRVQPIASKDCIALTDQHVGALGNHRTIASIDARDTSAKLMVRANRDAEPELIPRETWWFGASTADGDANDADHIWLEGGFSTGLIYDVVYTPRACHWVSAGFVAMRDLGIFIRDSKESPLYGHIDHTIAEGISQCGRFLRHFLHCGMNSDAQGKPVYDGVLAHIAGGRRGEFNHRFGQPSVQPTPSFGHLFPFTDTRQTDPQTNQSAGLLDACHASDTAPKIIYTDTAAEYWRGDASLTHTNLSASRDAPPPANVRRYLYSGCQHSPGLLPLTFKNAFGTRGRNLFSFLDYRPLYRASLENLRRWVVEGVEPPDSRYPSHSSKTAITRAEGLEVLAQIPAIHLPELALLPHITALNLGDRADAGVGTFPAEPKGEAYPAFVSKLDADGNEVAGVRMPDVSVPIATHTGFAPRHDSNGGDGQILEYMGSSVPFAQTEAIRDKTADPRPSIEARYADRDDYLAKISDDAKGLVAERHLLTEDIETCVELAALRYDAVMNA